VRAEFMSNKQCSHPVQSGGDTYAEKKGIIPPQGQIHAADIEAGLNGTAV
jgi:hypothetical protein